MATPWRSRFALLRNLGIAALWGCILLTASLLARGGAIQTTMLVAGLLAIVPAVFYLSVVAIWHWKTRYRGNHSDLWGALLLIETSGWFKLVYLFRDIIPDARQSGRYAVAELAFSPPSNIIDSSGGAPTR